MNILERIKTKTTYFDGGMGTLLQGMGLKPGELPDNWNITHPEKILAVHRAYLEAGCNIIKTNTFGASRIENKAEVIKAGISIAKQAVSEFAGTGIERYVAFDIGPLGRLLKPFGDLDFEEAVSIFAESVRIAAACGADLILIETMNDSYETKAAVLAAKENAAFPVFVTNVYDETGKLMTGATPGAMVAMLEGLGADAIGINCSLGPKQMLSIVPELLRHASVPVIVNPNAGLPRSVDGRTVYGVDAETFSETMAEYVRMGAAVIGGCCGTTPEYIKKTIEKTKDLPFKPIEFKNETVVSSYSHAVYIGAEPVLIGERINPTGKPKIKQALREGNLEYILGEGLSQQEKGAHILDVNVGLPEIDEVKTMAVVVTELQAVTDLPLQIDTVNPAAMEKAMRLYNGKPLVNSVNGKEESMKTIFPLVKKYGGAVIALTIDESGIPQTAEGRLAIAEKIVNRAKRYGISAKDIIVDPLAMTISSDQNSANVTLEALRLIKEKLGVKTSLGVSNISFGLPGREYINSTFFAIALQNGLNCAIMNPFSAEMMKVYYSFRALRGLDDNCAAFIDFASTVTIQNVSAQNTAANTEADSNEPLKNAIIKGLKEQAFSKASELLKTVQPLDIINHQIVPALDIVGKGFEEKTVFLPQLLMSAEAATAAFEAVKAVMKTTGNESGDRIILATVKGDIHDIGKNIVKVLLQNYGYSIIDLGRDVPPEKVCDCAVQNSIKLVGLSALMTTTVPSMEETIKLLRKVDPEIKIMVGGAVLTPEYAEMIGADYYAKDAMGAVRIAERFFDKTGKRA